MSNLLLVLLLFLLPVNNYSQVQNASLTDSVKQLKEVIVTATKTQESIIQIPYAVSKINAAYIQDFMFRSTPEALMGSTGIFVQKTNHGGGSPFVRALTGNQNLLMIDGIRLNNATYRYGPNQYFNTIDLYNVGSIEIARGTGSVQYGSDAMGGVIQVFTKEPVFAKKANWSSTIYGKAVSANMEYTGRAELNYQSSAVAFQLGFTNKQFGHLVGGDSTGVQDPSGYNEKAFDAKLKWKLNKNTLLTIAHQQLIQHDVPLYHRVTLENFNFYFFEPQQRKLSYLRLEKNVGGGILNKLSITWSSQQNKETRKYLKNGSLYEFKESDKVETVGLTLDLFSTFSKIFSANTGVEYYHDRVNSSKSQITLSDRSMVMQRGLYPDDATSGNFSVYSLHHVSFNKFQIEAGIRFNQVSLNMVDTTSAYKLGSITIKPSSFVSNFSILYKINSLQSIYGSFSSGFRAPNIDDMGTLGLVDFRYEIPAYDLKPEKSFNAEIGYKLIGKKTKLSVALFNLQLNDLITRVQIPALQVGGYNVYTKANNQQSYVRGFEFEYQLNLNQHFTAETNA
ncbi:MAG: TonB-dependent receptor, partial [Sediminibacterium sp.]|nr:TonB-dependent receptor [Sediminibacterium sp.]